MVEGSAGDRENLAGAPESRSVLSTPLTVAWAETTMSPERMERVASICAWERVSSSSVVQAGRVSVMMRRERRKESVVVCLISIGLSV